MSKYKPYEPLGRRVKWRVVMSMLMEDSFALIPAYEYRLLVLRKSVYLFIGSEWECSYTAKYQNNRPPVLTALTLMQQKLKNSEGEQLDMARWNPKPCICFQREDYGTILVQGKQILQFNKDFELQHKTDKTTFFEALQEATLMIGASNCVPLQMYNAVPGTTTADIDKLAEDN